MKTIFTIFIFSFFIFNSKAQWVELDPGVNVAYFSDVYAITPDIVVVVGANGTILKTTDGGETWLQKPSGTTLNLGKVQFTSPEIGYIITSGFESTMLKTVNGGETWTSKNIGEITFLSGLSCLNNNTIFLSGSDKLLLSENGGNSFDVVNSDFDYEQILFVNNEVGFAWNQLNGYLSRTENGGGIWIETPEVSPVNFLNEEIGFYYAEGLFKTIDGGEIFDLLNPGAAGGLTNILAVNENTVWGILPGTLNWDPSSQGIIKITYSDISPYTEYIWFDDNPEIDMLSIHFADENTGYIAGFKNGKGTIWKNETGINTMDTNEQERNNEIKVYPNPVTNELNIIFEKPIKADISLVDIMGKKVYFKTFYEDQVKINTSSFPKGTYILSVKTENKIFTKKIIIN